MKRKFSFSGFLVLAIVSICLLCPWLSPYDPYEIGASEPFLGPNRVNWLGTDDLGRDLLSRILYGGRITILVAIAATVIALIIGTAWGLAAGVRRGWLDEATAHMTRLVKPNGYWSKEKVLASALKFQNRTSWMRSQDSAAYNVARKNGWLEEACLHMSWLSTKPKNK